MSKTKKVVIMGAAGRDFHNFNVAFRDNPRFSVIAFTACQIPNIAEREYPPELAGKLYPNGIPIYREEDLPRLIQEKGVDEVVFAYSDVSHAEVMHKASLVNSFGADFKLLGTNATMLEPNKPLISVCAVRTGCGKSQTTRRIAEILRAKGVKTVVIRHPMPYGDLMSQRCQRFASMDDLVNQNCTIEEREEYERHIEMGHVVYAGVDYEKILRAAEEEADVLLWDGGNNDLPFCRPNLHIVLVDPHRAGHELLYYPGEANLRMADLAVVTKTGTAGAAAIEKVTENVRQLNPLARIIKADSVVSVADPSLIRGKIALVVEDGPTVTHGEMPHGAGHVAAMRWGASRVVDPRPYARGSILETFAQYPHLSSVLPAMGYGDQQVQELRETIEAVPCDIVLVGTPFDLARLLQIDKPLLRVSYELDEAGTNALEKEMTEFLSRLRTAPSRSSVARA